MVQCPESPFTQDTQGFLPCPSRWKKALPTGAQSCGRSMRAAFPGCCVSGAGVGAGARSASQAMPLGRAMPGWSQSLC